MTSVRWGKLILMIAIAELAGAIGAFFTAPAIADWYANLHKPPLAPPNWVFAPVWIILFALMGIAAYIIWSRGLSDRRVKGALMIFFGQLILNSLWSYIFFGLHNPEGAFTEIIFLWLAIALTIYSFGKISRPAAWLLAPYILWVSYAAVLNYQIFQLYGVTYK